MVTAAQRERAERQKREFEKRQESRTPEHRAARLKQERAPLGFSRTPATSKQKRRSTRPIQFRDEISGRIVRDKIEKGPGFEERVQAVKDRVARTEIKNRIARGQAVSESQLRKYGFTQKANIVLKAAQRNEATKRIGQLTRVIERRDSRTFVGATGRRYTVPRMGLKFTGRERPGGLISKEITVQEAQKRKEITKQRVAKKIAISLLEKQARRKEKITPETVFYRGKIPERRALKGIKFKDLTRSEQREVILGRDKVFDMLPGRTRKEKESILKSAQRKYAESIDKRILVSANVTDYLNRQKKLNGKLTARESIALIVSGYSYIGLKAQGALTVPFVDPLGTLKSMGRFGIDIGKTIIKRKPTGMVSDLIGQFARDPVGTSVEMYVSMMVFSFLGKGVGIAVRPLAKTRLGLGYARYSAALSNKLIRAGSKFKSIKPIQEIVKAAEKLKKAARKKVYQQKAIRTTVQILQSKKFRTLPRSRRKRQIKEIKKEAAKGPTTEEQIKILERKKAMQLEKKRSALRRQQKIEEKIAQGKGIKALRPIPTAKGFLFKDLITGKERFFKSRRQWLKAVKQQAKSTRDPKGGLIKSLRSLKKKTPEQRAKAIQAEIRRRALRRQLKIGGKIAQGESVKAARPMPTTKGYFFKDKITGKERFFKSRKQWLKAVKQQTSKKEILRDPLIENANKYLSSIKKVKKTLPQRISIHKNLVRIESKLKVSIRKTPTTVKKQQINRVKNIVEKEISSNQRQSQVLILKKAKPLERTVSKLKQQLKTKTKTSQKLTKQTKTLETKLGKLAELSKELSLTRLRNRFTMLGLSLRKTRVQLRKTKVAPNQIQISIAKSLQEQKKKLDTALSQSQSVTQSQSVSVSQAQSVSQAMGQLLRKLQAQSVSQSVLKAASKLITKAKTIKIPKPIIPTWGTKLKRGYVPLVNVIIRIRGVNKEIKLNTTPNRALKYIVNKVDRTTTRSFQIKIVGVRKGKDIGKISLRKFRLRKGVDKRVLRFVEKSKHAIDTRGEKRGLRISKLIKKRR